jgi:DNA gyrase subunit A
MRIVIELKRDAVAQVTLNQLWSHTPMQSNFGMNMLAIVDGQPKTLSLKDALAYFVEHRREVVTRRSLYELNQAEQKFHLVVGLLAALDNIDRVIEIIRAAKDSPEAKGNLIAEHFPKLGNLQALIESDDEQITKSMEQGYVQLTERQAQAILELRLHRLTGLERDKLADEAMGLRDTMSRLREILGDESVLLELIVGELEEVRDNFANPRRTEITGQVGVYTDEDLIVEEEMVVTVSHAGYVKRTPVTEYRAQKRGGKGVAGAKTKSEDFVEELFVASTHAYLLVFTNVGKVYWVKVHSLPLGGRTATGKPMVNFLPMASDEKMSAILPVREFEEDLFVITASRKGTVKKTPLSDYSRPRANGIIGAGIADDDELIAAKVCGDDNDVLLGTSKGMAIRFKTSDVRSMGRPSVGVRGIRLDEDDKLVGMTILEAGAAVLTVTSNGYGKRTKTEEYRVQQRGGRGIILIKAGGRNGDVVGVRRVFDEDHIMIITDGGTIIRMRCSGIPVLGRNTMGVRMVRVKKDERVQGFANLAEEEDEEAADVDGGALPPADGETLPPADGETLPPADSE